MNGLERMERAADREIDLLGRQRDEARAEIAALKRQLADRDALVRKLAGALERLRHAGEEGGYPPGFYHVCERSDRCDSCRVGLEALAAVPKELKP